MNTKKKGSCSCCWYPALSMRQISRA